MRLEALFPHLGGISCSLLPVTGSQPTVGQLAPIWVRVAPSCAFPGIRHLDEETVLYGGVLPCEVELGKDR